MAFTQTQSVLVILIRSFSGVHNSKAAERILWVRSMHVLCAPGCLVLPAQTVELKT